jgi:hypothetical protein
MRRSGGRIRPRDLAALAIFLAVFAAAATVLALLISMALEVLLPRGLARFIAGMAGAPLAAALATAAIDVWPRRYSGGFVFAGFVAAVVLAVPAAYAGYVPGLPSIDILAPSLIGLMCASLLLLVRRAPPAPSGN